MSWTFYTANGEEKQAAFPPAGDVSFGGYKATLLGAPTADTDAATKAYVDQHTTAAYGRYAWAGSIVSTSATWTKITGGTWTKELESDATQFDTATSTFTCRKAGIYLLSSTAGWAANVTGARGAEARRNNVQIGLAGIFPSTSTNSGFAVGIGIAQLAIGDLVDLWCYVNGATPNITAGTLSLARLT